MSKNVSRRVLLGGGVAVATIAATASITEIANAAGTHPVLRQGSSGSAVRELQGKLSAKGYWCGSADGSFGSLTLQAVYAVQKAYRLTRDGVVGPATWAVIDRLSAPRARTSSYGIEVDLSRQLLMVVSGGSARLTLNTSTGSGAWFWYNGRRIQATTPRGTFRMFSHGSNGWDYGALGGLYRPYYFTSSGIAVHGAPQIPPYPASHGCCRLSTSAQNMLIARHDIATGRTVTIY